MDLTFDAARSGPAWRDRGDGVVFPFLVERLGLSMHYGWFPEGRFERASLDTLRTAQRLFLDHVLEIVPTDAAEVLDVGTGTGDVAVALAERGHRVMTISPDPDQARWVKGHVGPRLRFMPLRFEDLPDEPRFDCIVFSESANYVDLENLLARSRELASPEATLVIAAPLATGRSDVFTDMHTVAEFQRLVERSSWQTVHEYDATQYVAPTLRLSRDVALSWIERALPRALHEVVRRRGGQTRLLRMLDEDRFLTDCRFMFVALRRDGRE